MLSPARFKLRTLVFTTKALRFLSERPMDITELEALNYPFVKLITQELIARIPLTSIEDIKLRKVEIYGYIYVHLKDLPFITQRIVAAQIRKELHRCLISSVKVFL